MVNKKMILFGIPVSCALLHSLYIPAFAATPAGGVPVRHGIAGAGGERLLGFAENLTLSLQQKGVDVTGLNAALANARSAVQDSDKAAFKDAMNVFRQDIQAGIKDGSIRKPVLNGTGPGAFRKDGVTRPGLNTTMETKLLGFAENLTATLQQKGVDVTGLNAALANARNAIQDSDKAAFKDAMNTFHQDIQAGIKDGSISASAIPRPVRVNASGSHPFATETQRGVATSPASSV